VTGVCRSNHKPAACHPERRHAAKGLCFICYNAKYPKAKAATCHGDRIAHAKGLCRSCYDFQLKQINPAYAEAQNQNFERWLEGNRGQFRVQVRAHGKLPRVRIRNQQLGRQKKLAAVGLTWEDGEIVLNAQGGGCGICKGPSSDRAFDIDHDHQTGEFRGFLCGRCNRGIGLLGDNIEGILAALAYLQRPRFNNDNDLPLTEKINAS
jgi:hypothetical protein